LKRILGTGFTNTALAAVEPNIKSHVLRLCERLEMESRKGPVDIARWFACFSFDVVSCRQQLTVGWWGSISWRELSNIGKGQ
jgi:cytochrome P450